MEFKLSMSNILLVILRAAKICQIIKVLIERRGVAIYFDSQLSKENVRHLEYEFKNLLLFFVIYDC